VVIQKRHTTYRSTRPSNAPNTSSQLPLIPVTAVQEKE